VAHGVDPREVDAVARRHTRGRFFICSVQIDNASDQQLRAEYKRLGYRLLSAEPLFVHDLRRIPRPKSPVRISQVRTRRLAEQFAKATRSRLLSPAYFAGEAPFRQYVALVDGDIVGWVRSVAAGRSTWCSDMYVRDGHRRRGIGTAMLAKMLRDDRALGANKSVLLSSKTGALLYPRVGYARIGTLLIWAPKKN
jgi:GNAT superfamily N-acetyltransferase